MPPGNPNRVGDALSFFGAAPEVVKSDMERAYSDSSRDGGVNVLPA